MVTKRDETNTSFIIDNIVIVKCLIRPYFTVYVK